MIAKVLVGISPIREAGSSLDSGGTETILDISEGTRPGLRLTSPQDQPYL